MSPSSESSSRSPAARGARRILIFRLSSLGDLVLSTAALSAIQSTGQAPEVDWVTASEYGILLEGHPVLRQLILYDRRRTGIFDWMALCWRLSSAGYDTVLDLHRNIRTLLARVIFLIRGSGARWHLVDKQRLRNFGYFTFKRWWPATLRPTPVVDEVSGTVARAVRCPVRGRPNLVHLIRPDFSPGRELGPEFAQGYLCVMPSAQWRGKRWAPAEYASAIQGLAIPIVVMGGKNDRESLALVDELGKLGKSCFSGVGRWNLREVATVLAHSRGYLGNDTGLAHLTEAVGAPAVIVSGPTSPNAGFGPWRTESGAVSSRLWCSPCGKLGKYCFRPSNRFICLENVDRTAVVRETERMLGNRGGSP